MIWIRRRSRRSAAGSSARTLMPSKEILPASGSIRRSSIRPMVVLPEPLSPTSANTSPRCSEKLTSVTTRADFLAPNRPSPEA